jgi:hypothetical protein
MSWEDIIPLEQRQKFEDDEGRKADDLITAPSFEDDSEPELQLSDDESDGG